MKYIFWGSPNFAKIILEKLIEVDLKPIALVCNPDKPFGRKKIITPPPTKVVAQNHHIKIFQPEKLDDDFISQIKALNADFFIVSAYSKIIPQTVLEIPRLGAVGAHPSLLPKYRGASPIQSVLLSDDKETGVTLYLMDEKMDHGDILVSKAINIDKDDSYSTLEEKLAILSANLLKENINNYYAGKIDTKEQNHKKATFTKKFTTEDGKIDLENDNPKEVYKKIKALNPDPGVYSIYNNKRTKLIEVKETSEGIIITKIIPEGKKLQNSNITLKKHLG